MVIELNRNPISDQTERYCSVGLSLEFLNDMAKAISVMQAAGYEPYDQLYGYVLHETSILRARVEPEKLSPEWR